MVDRSDVGGGGLWEEGRRRSLGGHVAGGADEAATQAARGGVFRAEDPREGEVGEARDELVAAGLQGDARGLDVAVHDTVAVHVIHPTEHARRETVGFFHRQRATDVDVLGEQRAADPVEDEGGLTVDAHQVGGVDDVDVAQPGLEPAGQELTPGELARVPLHHHQAVVRLELHVAHAIAIRIRGPMDLRFDAIVPDDFAGCERHARILQQRAASVVRASPSGRARRRRKRPSWARWCS